MSEKNKPPSRVAQVNTPGLLIEHLPKISKETRKEQRRWLEEIDKEVADAHATRNDASHIAESLKRSLPACQEHDPWPLLEAIQRFLLPSHYLDQALVTEEIANKIRADSQKGKIQLAQDPYGLMINTLDLLRWAASIPQELAYDIGFNIMNWQAFQVLADEGFLEAKNDVLKRRGRPKGSVRNQNDAHIRKLWTKARKRNPRLTYKQFFDNPPKDVDFRAMGYANADRIRLAVDNARH